MPNWFRSSVPTLLQDARRLYTNAQADAQIADRLALYKVPAATLDEGIGLIAAVEGATQDVGGEEADRSQATGRVRGAVDEVEDALVGDRDMARTAYGRDSDEYGALGLRGRLPDARAALLDAARTFYGTLQARPDLVSPIPGLTDAVVAERLAAVEAAATADTEQAAEGGEVQVASGDRKEAVAALREHASKTAAIARRALADRPQLLETLGLLARS